VNRDLFLLAVSSVMNVSVGYFCYPNGLKGVKGLDAHFLYQ
jgi:hypothetical protein